MTFFYKSTFTLLAIFLLYIDTFYAQTIPGKLSLSPDLEAEMTAQQAYGSQKVWGDLQKVEREYITYLRSGVTRKAFKPSVKSTVFQGDYVRIEAAIHGSMSEAINAMKALGAYDISTVGYLLDAWFPVNRIHDLNDMEEIRFVHSVIEPVIGVGNVTTQGDAGQTTDVLRSDESVSGAGIKVGILSDSYNTLSGESAGILSGDLPGASNPFGRTTAVNVIKEYTSTGTDEGRGMAEIVHDVAPDADLAFYTAFLGIADFARGIRLLAADGCDIIVDDVRNLYSPMYQDGILSEMVDSVADEGVIYLCAAGNQGDESYEGSYYASGMGTTIGSITYADYHLYGSGATYAQGLEIPGNTTATIVLNWNEPFYSVSGGSGATSNYDLLLLNSTLTTVVGWSSVNNVGGDPVEIVQYTNPSSSAATFYIMIARQSGSTSVNIKTIAFSGTYLNYDTNSGTAFGQANAEKGMSVGAVFYGYTPAYGFSTPVLESFSSKGGIPIYYDETGASLGGVVRNKPDIISVDGANTTFFGADIGFDADVHPNFFGTSAAAPHAAGAVALIMEQYPSLTPAQARTYIQNNAVSMGTSGFDFSNAYGLSDFDATFQDVQASLPVTLASFQATARQNQVLLSWETEVEDNLAAFVVESSLTSQNFESMKILAPTGSGSLYQTELTNLTSGWHYFRIRFEDIDGTITYSPVRRVNINASEAVSQVNVLNQADNFTFYWGGDLNDYTLDLYDLSGRQLGRWAGNGNNIKLNKEKLNHPFVVYKLHTFDGQSTKWFSGKLSLR